MRLLTKNNIKDAKKVETIKEVNFALKVRKETERERKKMNDAKSFYQKHREKMESQFIEFTDGIEGKRKKLTNEIILLENKKKEALKPVDSLLRDAKKLVRENEEEKENIKTQSSDLKVREVSVQSEKKKLGKELVELQKRSIMIDDDTERLKSKKNEFETERITFSKKKDKEEEVIKITKEEISGKEKLLKEKELKLDKREELLDREKDNINKEWRVVKDQRATLERAFKRLK